MNNSSISDYTYEDFVAKFETNVTGEDMFEEDTLLVLCFSDQNC